MTDCLLQNRLVQALEFSDILLGKENLSLKFKDTLMLCSSGNLRKFAKGSEAHIELILRKMKIYAELGRKSELDALVQSGLIDAYNETQLCTTILKTRDKLYADYFSNKT